jgi:hypothetical protein
MRLPLVELDLGQEGLDFVRHRLEGGRTLSRHLRSEDLSTGEVVTHLPEGTSFAEAKQFEYGGKLPTPPRETWTKTEGGIVIPTPNLREHLVGLITRYLSRSGNVCLLENAMASRGDRWLQRSEVDAVFLGNEVYHLLTKSATSAAVDAAVRSSYTPNMFVGALSSVSGREQFPIDRGELTVDLVREVARHASMICVAAYDAEGYVLWRRR